MVVSIPTKLTMTMREPLRCKALDSKFYVFGTTMYCNKHLLC